jgi:hypothetical protein
MRAVARLATIGLAAIAVIVGQPSAGAVETTCALPPPFRDEPIARITVDSERHMAFIYTSDDTKFAVNASGNLVQWAIGNDQPPRPEPDFAQLEGIKEFAWEAAVSGRCPAAR